MQVERMQKSSESLYTFLLQKKSEAEITSSAISSNIQHIEPSVFYNTSPVFPQSSKVYLIALLIGLSFPILTILVGFLTSGAYGHSLGGAMGLGYVPCKGEKPADILASTYEIDVMGTKVKAEASLRPMYDPKSERVKV